MTFICILAPALEVDFEKEILTGFGNGMDDVTQTPEPAGSHQNDDGTYTISTSILVASSKYIEIEIVVKNGKVVSVDGDSSVTTVKTQDVWQGNDVGITKHADENMVQSPAQELHIPRRPATPAPIGEDCISLAQNDGRITNVDETMEYRKEGETEWMAVGGSVLTAQTPGDYEVRVKPTSTSFASLPGKATVAPYDENNKQYVTITFQYLDEAKADEAIQVQRGASVAADQIPQDARWGAVGDAGAIQDFDPTTKFYYDAIVGEVLAEATVTSADQSVVTDYDSLEHAIVAAEQNETVTMLADVTLAELLSIQGKTIFLDVAGKTLSVENRLEENNIWVDEDSNVTLQDSVGGGKLNATLRVNGVCTMDAGTVAGDVEENNHFTMNGGVVNGYVTNAVQFTMNGGTVKGGITVAGQNQARFTMNGGTVQNATMNIGGSVEQSFECSVFVVNGIFALSSDARVEDVYLLQETSLDWFSYPDSYITLLGEYTGSDAILVTTVQITEEGLLVPTNPTEEKAITLVTPGANYTMTKDDVKDFSFTGTGVQILEDGKVKVIVPPKYTVQWINQDGSALETDNKVPQGEMPEYNGNTPTKAADAQYAYAFDQWAPALAEVTDNETYQATYIGAKIDVPVGSANYDAATGGYKGAYDANYHNAVSGVKVVDSKGKAVTPASIVYTVKDAEGAAVVDQNADGIPDVKEIGTYTVAVVITLNNGGTIALNTTAEVSKAAPAIPGGPIIPNATPTITVTAAPTATPTPSTVPTVTPTATPAASIAPVVSAEPTTSPVPAATVAPDVAGDATEDAVPSEPTQEGKDEQGEDVPLEGSDASVPWALACLILIICAVATSAILLVVLVARKRAKED